MTTREDIRDWFLHGLSEDATHMVVVCDTFDYCDYPVYTDDPMKKVKNPGSMQRVMEVYDLRKDMESQLREHRSWNF